MNTIEINDKLKRRFYSKILTGKGEHLYFECKKYTIPRPRGAFTIGKKSYPAGSIFWFLERGEYDKNLIVFPICGDEKCVNPKHSARGTRGALFSIVNKKK